MYGNEACLPSSPQPNFAQLCNLLHVSKRGLQTRMAICVEPNLITCSLLVSLLSHTTQLSPDSMAPPLRNPCSKQYHLHSSSLEDVGNYDDEEEGDSAPPLPPRTEDALILVDPPPLTDFKKPLNIYKTNAHLLPLVHGRHSSSSCSQEELHSKGHRGFGSRQRTVLDHSRPLPFMPPKLMKSYSQGDGLDTLSSPEDPIPSQPPPIPPRNLAQYSPRSKARRFYQQEDRYTQHQGNHTNFGYALQHHRQ